MRGSAVLVALAACTSEPRAPIVMRDAREPTFEVVYLDRIDGAPATHLAVGGRMRVRITEGPATFTSAVGPFSITPITHDTFAIAALDRGAGQIEIETAPAGFARFKVTAEPIARVDVVDRTVVLFDDLSRRLVDTNLRLSGGSAPVSFAGAWDRIEVGSLPPGVHDIFVRTDLLGPTRVRVGVPKGPN